MTQQAFRKSSLLSLCWFRLLSFWQSRFSIYLANDRLINFFFFDSAYDLLTQLDFFWLSSLSFCSAFYLFSVISFCLAWYLPNSEFYLPSQVIDSVSLIRFFKFSCSVWYLCSYCLMAGEVGRILYKSTDMASVFNLALFLS